MIATTRTRTAREVHHLGREIYCPAHRCAMVIVPRKTGIFECLDGFETETPCRWRWKSARGYYKCSCGRRK